MSVLVDVASHDDHVGFGAWSLIHYSILCPPKSPQVASAELVTQLLSGMGVHPIDCEVSLV